MNVIYIAGKYRASTESELEDNIRHAEAAAKRLWKQGWAVITPHLNTAHFGGICDDSVWLKGDLEILRRCDAVYMLENWTRSQGAQAEHAQAYDMGLDIYYEDEEVE